MPNPPDCGSQLLPDVAPLGAAMHLNVFVLVNCSQDRTKAAATLPASAAPAPAPAESSS